LLVRLVIVVIFFVFIWTRMYKQSLLFNILFKQNKIKIWKNSTSFFFNFGISILLFFFIPFSLWYFKASQWRIIFKKFQPNSLVIKFLHTTNSILKKQILFFIVVIYIVVDSRFITWSGKTIFHIVVKSYNES